MSKQLRGKETRQQLKAGIDEVANMVKITLGPKGRNVCIGKDGRVGITKDGVTVARFIFPENEIESMGAMLMKQAAESTVYEAGDGTTTTTLLCQYIAGRGIEEVDKGRNPHALKRGMNQAMKDLTKFIAEKAIPIGEDFDRIEQVATISANNKPEIGKMIREAFEKVGVNGHVIYGDSQTDETHLKVYEGFTFDVGLYGMEFATDRNNGLCEFNNPLIVISDLIVAGTMDSSGIATIFDYAHMEGVKRALRAQANLIFETTPENDLGGQTADDLYNQLSNTVPQRDRLSIPAAPLVLIVQSLDAEHIRTIIMNAQKAHENKGGMRIAVMCMPPRKDVRKDILQDISVMTGGFPIYEDAGGSFKHFTFEMFGQCDRIVIRPNRTEIYGGKSDKQAQEAHIDRLKEKMLTAEGGDKKYTQERLARLQGGVAVIHVGAATPVEQQEQKDLVEDAVCATKATIEEGYVVGGGIFAYNTWQIFNTVPENIDSLTDEEMGYKIVIQSLLEPLKQISVNAGIDYDSIISNITEKRKEDYYKNNFMYVGFNAHTETTENLMEAGVIDPAKVLRVSMEAAISVASTVMSTEGIIYDSNIRGEAI